MGIKGLTKLLSDHAPGCMREQKFDGYLDRKAGGLLRTKHSTDVEFTIVVTYLEGELSCLPPGERGGTLTRELNPEWVGRCEGSAAITELEDCVVCGLSPTPHRCYPVAHPFFSLKENETVHPQRTARDKKSLKVGRAPTSVRASSLRLLIACSQG
jgi:hypothetical protein